MHEWNQGGKPAVLKYNRLNGSVVKIPKYKNITIYHAIYIKLFSDGNFSYLTVYTYDVLSTTNNKI